MKIAVWSVFSLIAVLWTGSVLLLIELAQWAAGAIASGKALELRGAIAEWPVPQWLTVWTDPAWIQSVRDGLVWALGGLTTALPWLGSAVGWLVPLLWTLWGLVFVLMLALAGGAHVLVGRFLLAPSPHRA